MKPDEMLDKAVDDIVTVLERHRKTILSRIIEKLAKRKISSNIYFSSYATGNNDATNFAIRIIKVEKGE